ncbi:DUF2180 family protein [Streptomyces purpureus]|uniref:DUF2180 family protein n=1 Tax=Streptomyces purpureus TaxID=1951 RepID=UPI0037B9CF57
MWCFECRQSGKDEVAEAICRQCGVAVCRRHAHVERQELHEEAAGLAKSTTSSSAP